MFRKKNYKEEEHFSQYFSILVPRPDGTRCMVYYKRYKPKTADANLYDYLHGSKKEQTPQEFPIDRSLQLISFDQSLEFLLPLLKKIGKIRRFTHGQTSYKNKEAFYSIAVFKFEFDLVKCFRDDLFQMKANEVFPHSAAEQDKKQVYRQEVIGKHLKDQLDENLAKMKEAEEEGYNVVTDRFGQFKANKESNEKFIEDMPQVRKKKKAQKS